MLKNHTIKANYCWKSLKKAMLGMQFLEGSKFECIASPTKRFKILKNHAPLARTVFNA
jgi:hypothetical protein